jgi:histidine racemase
MEDAAAANADDQIREKIKLAETAIGMPIAWARNQQDIDALLDKGLIELYQRAFSKPPYEESFTRDEVRDTFREYVDEGGDVFVACDEITGVPVAFYATTPLSLAFLKATGLEKHSLGNSSYHADEGVEESYRKKGISSTLMSLALENDRIRRRSHALLRTSIQNYTQIHSFAGKNLRHISDVFQDAVSTRTDGSVKTDRRAFYVNDLQDNNPVKCDTLNRVTVARPGGNDTALVWDAVPRNQQAALSLRIQKAYPGVEQVMFVEKKPDGSWRGQMAGGEFCGNATRALAYVLANGRDTDVTLEVSGMTGPVTVNVRKGEATINIAVADGPGLIKKSGADSIVDLGGITFLITAPGQGSGAAITNAAGGPAGREQEALRALKRAGLDTRPAAGVLVVEEIGPGKYRLDPYVYVSETGTLRHETSCGSGSAALGILLADAGPGNSAAVEIEQPSGLSLFVGAVRDAAGNYNVSVDGAVMIPFDGRMRLIEEYKPKAANPGGP